VVERISEHDNGTVEHVLYEGVGSEGALSIIVGDELSYPVAVASRGLTLGQPARMALDDAEEWLERSLALVRRRKAQLAVAELEVEDCHRYGSQGEWARAYMALEDRESTGLPLVEGD
jgi:hypothetical protein